MDDIRIKISGDAKDIQPTIDKLSEIGEVSKKNAEQFKQEQAIFEANSAKRQKLLKEEIADLDELKKRKAAAYNVDDIKGFEKSIKDSQERIRLLSSDTTATAKSMGSVVTQTENLGKSLTKSYSVLRTIANIIPGIGISGIVLAGYEALVALIEEISDASQKLAIEDSKYNIEHLENLNSIIEREQDLKNVLNEIAIARGIANRTATQEDLESAKLSEQSQKEKQKIFLKYAKERQEAEKDRPEFDPNIAENTRKQAAFFDVVDRIQRDRDKELLIEEEKFQAQSAEIRAKYGDKKKKQLAQDRYLSQQELENEKQDIETQAKLDETRAKQEETDKVKLLARLEEIEEKKNQDIYVINRTEAVRKYKFDVETANQTITDKDQLNTKLLNLQKELNDKLSKLQTDQADKTLLIQAKLYDDLLNEIDKETADADKKARADNAKRVTDLREQEQIIGDELKTETTRRYNEGLISKKKYDREILEDDIYMQEQIMVNEDKTSKEYVAAEKQKQEDLKKLRDLDKADRKKDLKELASEGVELVKFVLDQYEASVEARISAIDHQIQNQRDAIDAQRQLAIAGKANDLAFEEKRRNDLEKQRAAEAKKLKKAKELEIFLNALASFSKDDPKTALGKALALIATTIATEATFAEEGGILGKINEKSWKGRKHRGGGDILVHAQTGEGLFSRQEVANMGGENAFMDFKNLLASPLKEKPIPMSGMVFQGSMDIKGVERGIDNLTNVVKNKKETNVHWETAKDMFAMFVDIKENGVTTSTKHILNRKSIRG